MGLLTGTCVAIDGSKFKRSTIATATSRKASSTGAAKQIEESVSRYLSQLDTADRQDPTPELAAKVERLMEKIARLGQEMERLRFRGADEGGARPAGLADDPDARSMATSGRGSGLVGYNVQVAVETEHHLIVAHAVTNAGSDRAQLSGWPRGPSRALEGGLARCGGRPGLLFGEQIWPANAPASR